MKTVYVSFSVKIPKEVSYRDAHEFFEMEIKGEGGVSSNNPLIDYDLQSLNPTAISIR